MESGTAFTLNKGEDSCLSYLPLAHVAERLMYFGMFYGGGRIGIFANKNKKDLPKALALV